MNNKDLEALVGRAIQAERDAILAKLRVFQDSVTARAVVTADEVLQAMMRHVADDGIANCIKMIEDRNDK